MDTSNKYSTNNMENFHYCLVELTINCDKTTRRSSPTTTLLLRFSLDQMRPARKISMLL